MILSLREIPLIEIINGVTHRYEINIIHYIQYEQI